MKILLVHDEYGNIKSVAVAAGEPNLRAGLRPQRGELVTEVEVVVFGTEELRRNPRAVSENFRVDTAGAKLVRKNPTL